MLNKNFKQKYFLFCRDCRTVKIKKFSELEKKPHKKQIKIESL